MADSKYVAIECKENSLYGYYKEERLLEVL